MSNKIKKMVNFIEAFSLHKRKLAKFFNISYKEVEYFYREMEFSKFLKELKEKTRNLRGNYYLSMLSPFRAPLLYVICRIEQPRIVIETGVANGYSSFFILYALEKNKKGRLFSIDLPAQPGQELAGNRATGWLVPDELRGRWSLIFGPSREKLPALLQNIKSIDLFFHDSDHSYENMMFEFNKAWEYLKPKGQLLADDITENIAFREFVKRKRCRNIELFKLGIAIK